MNSSMHVSGNYLVFRLFIASTFQDFIEERRMLHERVFPVVREFCLSKDIRFLPIDLRYGIRDEAIIEQNLVRSCIEEVRRCRDISPYFNFMTLLGDRYGTITLAESIPADDFLKLLPLLPPQQRERAMKWYRLDKNAVPATYVLQPRGKDWKGNWRPLRDALFAASHPADIAPETRRALTASITEQEIYAGLLNGMNPARPIIIRRTLTNGATQSRAIQRIFFESSRHNAPGPRLRAALEEALKHHFPNDITTYQATLEKGRVSEASLNTFRELMTNLLIERVSEAITAAATSGNSVSTTTFAASRLKYYQPQTAGLKESEDYLAGSSNIPKIVTGETGIGKTTLLVKAASMARDAYPNAVQLEYFIGGSSPVATTSELLASLASTIIAAYAPAIEVPQDRAKLEAFLPECLELATATKPLTIFIDALDQLQQDAALTRWIPDRLPNHVHLIISILPGNDRDTLTRRLGTAPFDLQALPQHEASALFDSWMAEQSRTLTPHQKDSILAYYASNPNPLALRVLVEFARRWPSWQENIPAFAPTTDDLVDSWLAELEKPDRHGDLLPRYLLGLIGSGRNGLAEDELIGVINQQLKAHKLAPLVQPTRVWPATTSFPMVLWARLYAEINWMCTERQIDNTRVLNFYHRQFREAVERRYLQSTFQSAPARPSLFRRIFAKPAPALLTTTPQSFHADLAEFFGRKTGGQEPYRKNTAAEPRASVNERMVSELAFHYYLSGQHEHLKTLLFDGEYLQAHIQAAKTSEALVDLAYLEHDPDVALLREVMELSQPILDALPQEVPNQIWGRSETIFNQMHPWARWEDPHLQLQSHTLIQPATGRQAQESHHNKVKCCLFIKQGTQVLSASEDRTMRIWDVATGTCLFTLKGHRGPIRTCAYDPHHNLIASGSDDTTVRLWDDHGEQVHMFADHSTAVLWVAFSPNGRLLVSGAENGAIRVWDVATRQLLHHFTGHTRAINRCVFNGAGDLLASASNDATMRVWNVAPGAPFTSAPIHLLNQHTDAVTACLFTADGRLISASADATLRVWDLQSGNSIELKGHTGKVNDCALHPHTNHLLLSGSEDQSMRVWDINSAREAAPPLLVQLGGVRACCFANDGVTAVGATWGNKVIAWEWAAVPTTYQELDGPGFGLNACAFSADASMVIAASEDKTIHMWETRTWSSQMVFGGRRGIIRACAVSRNGAFVARGLSNGMMILEDTTTHQTIFEWQAHRQCVRGCAFSPDGTYILSGSEDRRLLLWKRGTTQYEEFIDPDLPTAHDSHIRFCGFSRDGKYVVSAGGNNRDDLTIRLWDPTNRALIRKFTGQKKLIIECCFSPDGNFLYSASFDNTIYKWEIATGALLATYPPTSGSDLAPDKDATIRTCDLNQAGDRLSIGRQDGTIALIEVTDAGMRTLIRFKAHDHYVNTCRFSMDGHYIISCASEGSVNVWEVARINAVNPAPVFTWRGDRRTLVCMAYHATSRRLFVAEDDILHTLGFVHLPIDEPS